MQCATASIWIHFSHSHPHDIPIVTSQRYSSERFPATNRIVWKSLKTSLEWDVIRSLNLRLMVLSHWNIHFWWYSVETPINATKYRSYMHCVYDFVRGFSHVLSPATKWELRNKMTFVAVWWDIRNRQYVQFAFLHHFWPWPPTNTWDESHISAPDRNSPVASYIPVGFATNSRHLKQVAFESMRLARLSLTMYSPNKFLFSKLNTPSTSSNLGTPRSTKSLGSMSMILSCKSNIKRTKAWAVKQVSV